VIESISERLDDFQTVAASSHTLKLYERFQDRIASHQTLNRTLVSFQANKAAAYYGWFRYKEGFSHALVGYLLRQLANKPGILLDPFVGSGVALFAAQEMGWQTHGIEILPVGVATMQARMLGQTVDAAAFVTAMQAILAIPDFDPYFDVAYAFRHIAITKGAFPPAEERQLVGYQAYCHRQIGDVPVRQLLLFAALCVLEDISYTRKDGQYLRWDARSGRAQGSKPFNKGYIPPFRQAIAAKLHQMANDLAPVAAQPRLFSDDAPTISTAPMPVIMQGSSLDILPNLASNSFDAIITSPPYANRYDYTRTYALELAFLRNTSEAVKALRQSLLSCTVENKSKEQALRNSYADQGQLAQFTTINQIFHSQVALHEVLGQIERLRQAGGLNNANVVRMLHNYFYEMTFIIFEMARVLKPGGSIAMVNDNVRYGGTEIPVDLLLCAIAETCGLHVRHIWTLERGKGNSSQQMGQHGRSELRKCVYVWQKVTDGDA
jgi:DNA modification methylase